MKLLPAIFISLSLFVATSAQTNQAGVAAGSGVQGSQTITITRNGSQPSRQGPAEPEILGPPGVTKANLMSTKHQNFLIAHWLIAAILLTAASAQETKQSRPEPLMIQELRQLRCRR